MAEKKEANDKLEEGIKLLAAEGDKTYPNMDELPVFTDGIVLANIRYFYDRVHEAPKQPPTSGTNGWSPIFTQVGPILIALNPFVHDFPCYGQTWQDAFHKAGLRGEIATVWRRLGPHCFCTIEQVYQDLRKCPHQGVVICGESGAGKTFTNKLMLDYLLDKGCALDRARARTKSMIMATPEQDRLPTVSDETKKSVEAANELLEAFGNAKTGRNDNSSRFGKFTQLFFISAKDNQYVVSYPKVQTYLLERSRVTMVPEGERSYHIMHYLGQETAQREILGDLYKALPFEYIKGALNVPKNELDKDGKAIPFDDDAGYRELKKQMVDAGFSDEYTMNVFRLISALMYLGNCNFGEGDEERQSAPVMEQSSKESMSLACSLLGLKEDALLEALTHKMKPISENGKLTMKLFPVYKKVAVHAQRDAIAKNIYSLIFDDIVARLNSMLSKSKTNSGGTYIGMLDIFGFEDMPKNGFEQMFINLTNETIQQFFNDVFFTMELKAYDAEGITVNAAEVKQNCQPTLDLFGEKQKGIIYLLNDQAKQANPQDGDKLVSLFNQKFEKAYDQRYKVATPNGDSIFKKTLKNKEAKWQSRGLKKLPQVEYKDSFVIQHYAGMVIYTVEEFATKSRDKMESHLVESLQKSENEFFANLVAANPDEEETATSKGKDLSVGLKFKDSLDSLLTTLKEGPSVFVRCIKPKARAGEPFNVEEVYEQLKTGGVISALDIRSKGYPDRKDYTDFMNEFWCLERGNFENAGSRSRTTSPRERCSALLMLFVGPEGNTTYQLGTSKVFMKTGILSRLREAMDVIKVRCAQLVKRKWRALKVMQWASGIEAFEDRCNDAECEAEAQHVQEVDVVKKAISAAQAAIKQCDATLQEDEEAVQALKRKKEQGGTLPKEDEQRLVNLMDSLEHVFFQAQGKLDDLEATIRKVCERKVRAQEKISKLITEQKMKASVLLDQVAEVQGCCRNLNDPKQASVSKQCDEVKANLQRIIEIELNEIGAQILEAVNLSKDNPAIELPPIAFETIKKAAEAVEATQQSGADLLEAKRRFEHEAYTVEKDLHDLRDQAKERLKQLEADSLDAVKHGFRLLADAIDRAERLDEEVETLRENATDAAAFIAKIHEYLAAEQEAQDACRKVEKLKSEKVDRDAMGRRRIFNEFDKNKELLGLYEKFKLQLGELSVHIQELDKGGPDGLGSDSDTRTHLREHLGSIEKNLSTVGFEAMANSSFSDGGLGFNYEGDWSAERFKLLGPEVGPYEGLCPILDTEQYTKIVDAVEALNSGCRPMEDGYCIGWSKTWGRWYMLYTEAAERTALDALASTQVEIEAAQKKSKLLGLQSKMGRAIKELKRRDYQVALDKKHDELEDRIRASVKSDIDNLYNKQVSAGVEERTQALKEHGRSEISRRQEQQNQFLTEQQAEELQFQEHIRELTVKLERVRIKQGDNGQLPALYAQLLDAEQDISELKDQCEEVRDLVVMRIQDMQEAMQYADALAEDPEHLPNLKLFIEVLHRGQERHSEAERRAEGLGVEGQYADLAAARDIVTQVAQMAKRVCDGTVTFDDGLTEELQSIRTGLSESQVTFKRLQAAFDHWLLRLENAAAFMEQGMRFVDVKTTELQHVQDIREPDKPQATFWDKMVSGMMENFCTAERPLSKSRNGGLRLESTGGGVRELVRENKKEQLSLAGVSAKPTSPHLHPSINSKTKRTNFSIDVGDIVEDLHTKQLRGTVRFVGQTKFAAGDWVGIELDAPIGKNDGSVNGQAYFSCPSRHGIFMRPTSVTKVFGQGGDALSRSSRPAFRSAGADSPSARAARTSGSTPSSTPGNSPSSKGRPKQAMPFRPSPGTLGR